MQNKVPLTDKELIALLQEYYFLNNECPIKNRFPHRGTYTKRFGSWNNALELAGIPLNRDPTHKKTPPKRKNSMDDPTKLTKICKTCKKEYPRTPEYFTVSTYSNGDSQKYNRYRSYCRECWRKRPRPYSVRNTITRSALTREFKIKAVKYLSPDLSCHSCGESFESCMLQFHHVDPKTKTINLGLAIGALKRNCSEVDWVPIYNELDKCNVVCSNCHHLLHSRILDNLEVNPEYVQKPRKNK